jgi:hypothetical protein
MATAIEELKATAERSLTAVGFTGARVQRVSDTMLIATVPASRRQWAAVALKSFVALPLSDDAGRARYALFPAQPEDAEPYQRTVYYLATGDGVPERLVGKPLVQSVFVTPGDNTEADIPKNLAITIFGTVARADGITVTRLA